MSRSTPRGVSPVIGVVLLVALTVVLASAVGVAGLSLGAGTAPPAAALVAEADAGTDRVTLVHRGGDALSAGSLRVRIAVDGEPLRHQPSVPFVGARGFRGAPTGPFNAAGDGQWTAGERASLRLAATNDPGLADGSTVRVRVWTDGAPIADLEVAA